MVLWEGSLGSISGDHGSAQFFSQLYNLLGTAQHVDLFTHKYHWALCLEQHLQSLFNLSGVSLRNLCLLGTRQFNINFGSQKVGWYLQFARSRTAGLEPLKGIIDVVRNGLDLRDRSVPVGDRLEHPKLILGLVGS